MKILFNLRQFYCAGSATLRLKRLRLRNPEVETNRDLFMTPREKHSCCLADGMRPGLSPTCGNGMAVAGNA